MWSFPMVDGTTLCSGDDILSWRLWMAEFQASRALDNFLASPTRVEGGVRKSSLSCGPVLTRSAVGGVRSDGKARRFLVSV